MSTTVKPDHYYLIEGKDLIRLNILCRALKVRIMDQNGMMTKSELFEQVDAICKSLPVEPMEAF